MEKGIIETLGGVLARPISTIRSICEQRPIGWAIIVVLVVSLVSAVAWIKPGDLEGMGLPDLGMPAILVGSSIVNMVTLVIFTAIYHIAASVLGGRGTYGGLFCGSAFAGLPRIFTAPLAAIGLLPIVGGLLSGLGTFGVGLWPLVLNILAVRENYLVSTGRAILIYLFALSGFVCGSLLSDVSYVFSCKLSVQ
ncbi:YIP1 family protein [Dehalococcoidia bacterium]|nr:YIP1 family protein [Dehalococcoidia bacterium]